MTLKPQRICRRFGWILKLGIPMERTHLQECTLRAGAKPMLNAWQHWQTEQLKRFLMHGFLDCHDRMVVATSANKTTNFIWTYRSALDWLCCQSNCVRAIEVDKGLGMCVASAR